MTKTKVYETVSITRPSMATGRPFTAKVYILREWTSYTGIETGRPVIVAYHYADGPARHEVLSAAENAATVIEWVEV